MRTLTLGWVALIAAGILVSPRIFAQGEEPPAQPAPPAEPPPTDVPPAEPVPGTAPTAPTTEPQTPPPPVAQPGEPGAPGAPVTAGAATAPQPDTGVKTGEVKKPGEEPKKLKWHGSVFFVDQSVSSQTVGVGSDYQSNDPVYELWYSFRPRWYFYETDSDAFNVNARFEATQEMTNSDTSTRNREFLFQDIWLNGVYEHWFVKDKETGYSTKVSVGPRLILGTSKASRGVGNRGAIGAGGGVSETVPIRGPNEDSFQTASFKGSAFYTHPLNRCTTSCKSDFEYTRQDTGGRTLISDQLSGSARVEHQVVAALDTELQILEKLKFGLSYIWVLQWAYPVGDQDATVNTATGPVTASSVDSPTRFRVSPWVVANVDYDLLDEVGLSLGYYNYTNQIGPDGERRNPLWSPDARFFFTVTANLDEIYLTASGERKAAQTAATKKTKKQAISVNGKKPAL